MVTLLFFSCFAFLILAFRLYGRFLSRRFELNDKRPTPAHTDYDGIDKIPAHRVVLLGHHFSSIAGAGPIVGPIIASLAFGWLPALLWIILGTTFIGGVHDFSSLVASIRHRSRSIAEIAREYMSPTAFKLLLSFIWLSLIYILVVFIDLTSNTFTMNGGVATSSIIYIFIAILFGLSLYRFKLSLGLCTLIYVPIVFVTLWVGQLLPLPMPPLIGNSPQKTWDILLILYCFIASVQPVWILLQPRDYLSSYLLYASVLAGLLGILFGGFPINYPATTTFFVPSTGTLFPMLFIIIACGACSGFHSLVASGTTAKQLDKESDAIPVGYGGTFLEGLVAVIAVVTIIILQKGDPLTHEQPLTIYASGIARFLSIFGVPKSIGSSFGLLAVSTFILTTLDTATRLGRYIFEEFFDLKGRQVRFLSTSATLILPTIFVLITLKDPQGNPIPAWKAIWPVFGATNQLLAGLALLVITVWFIKSGKNASFILIPMFFMMFVTISALILLILRYKLSVIGAIATILLLLAFFLIRETKRALRKG